MTLLAQLAGLLGAAFVLLAYWLLSARRVAAESRTYHTLNAVGAVILVAVAVAGRQIGFGLLNAAWSAIAVRRLWRLRPARTAARA